MGSAPHASQNNWPEWAALVAAVPELGTLLDEIDESRQHGRHAATIWFKQEIPGRIRMILNRAVRDGATVPAEAQQIATDRLIAALLTRSRRLPGVFDKELWAFPNAATNLRQHRKRREFVRVASILKARRRRKAAREVWQ